MHALQAVSSLLTVLEKMEMTHHATNDEIVLVKSVCVSMVEKHSLKEHNVQKILLYCRKYVNHARF